MRSFLLVALAAISCLAVSCGRSSESISEADVVGVGALALTTDDTGLCQAMEELVSAPLDLTDPTSVVDARQRFATLEAHHDDWTRLAVEGILAGSDAPADRTDDETEAEQHDLIRGLRALDALTFELCGLPILTASATPCEAPSCAPPVPSEGTCYATDERRSDRSSSGEAYDYPVFRPSACTDPDDASSSDD